MSTKHYVWLTSEAYERLRAELAALSRHESPDANDAEMAGVVGADPEYLADARHRKARIRQIQDLLSDAVVGEAPPDDGIAEPGMVLTVRFDDDNDTETFLLGTRDGTDLEGIPVYSPASPLGVALFGARQGEVRSYTAPNGTTIRVKLVSVVPYGHHD